MAVRQSIEIPRAALRRVFFQRCFYLFVVLLALIGVSPFIEGPRGNYLLAGFNAFVILAAAAALGRTALSFLLVFVLIGGAVGMRFASMEEGRDSLFNWALLLHALVYICVLFLLLRYVFGPEVMDGDRLWGAASAYLMIGILWCFVYALVELEHTQTFVVRGQPANLQLIELLYFSFSTLTTIGFGDIVPLSRGAQMAAIFEGIVGTLFLAILIAKLVGVYPPPAPQPTGGKDETHQ
jgi:ion channel